MTLSMPVAEWVVNLLLCFTVWGVLAWVSSFLHTRKLWNDIMSVACFLWVLGLRFRHRASYWVPLAVFAVGIYQALEESRWNRRVRAVLALAGSALWFQFGMWNLVAVMFYFCSGCFTFFR